MQIIYAQTTGTARPAAGYSAEITAGAVSAVKESAPLSAGSTTVNLSQEAIGRYARDIGENEPAENRKAGYSPQQAETEQPAASGTEESKNAIADTMERLQDMLEEAQKRLEEAQRQLAQAMAEMRNAKDESQKMAAMLKVQAAQAQVISAQGEVLEIYSQINELLEEQQKQS